MRHSLNWRGSVYTENDIYRAVPVARTIVAPGTSLKKGGCELNVTVHELHSHIQLATTLFQTGPRLLLQTALTSSIRWRTGRACSGAAISWLTTRTSGRRLLRRTAWQTCGIRTLPTTRL